MTGVAERSSIGPTSPSTTAERGDVSAGDGILVGRERELQVLEGFLDVSSEQASTVAVVGEPGIGKTVLLQEASRTARGVGLRVVQGRASEFEREIPFGLAVDAFDAMIASLTPRQLEQLGEGVVSELAAVFPSMREDPRRPPDAVFDSRSRWHQALRLALESVAQERPLLVCLDDVQWADDVSLELVAHLISRPCAGVRLALAYRSRPVPSILALAVCGAQRTGTAVVIEPDSLTEDEAAALMGGRIGRSDRAATYEESGGNPFYLRELLRGRSQLNRVASTVARDEADVPRAIEAQIAQEITQLSPEARALAQAGAVSAQPFAFDFALDVSQLAERQGLDALDELLAVDLVRSAESPNRFAFRHPIVRRAVYVSAGAGSRLAAHTRAAQALTQRSAPLPELAHHVERSASPGDESAAELLSLAARDVGARAPSTAARWLACALRVLPDTAPRDRRAELLLHLASALSADGRPQESRAAFAEALDLIPSDEAELRALVVCSLARLDHGAGRRDATDLIDEALRALPNRESTAALALGFERAVDRAYGGDPGDVIDAAQAAWSGADAHGDRSMCAAALSLIAFGHVCDGDPNVAAEHAVKAARLFDAVDEVAAAVRPEGLAVLAAAELGLEQLGESADHAERAIDAPVAAHDQNWSVFSRCVLAAARLAQGRLDEAHAWVAEALSLAEPGGDRPALWALSVHSQIAAVGGDTELAAAAVERAGAPRAHLPVGLLDGFADAARAVAATHLGRAALVSGGFGAGQLNREAAGVARPWRAPVLKALSDSELATGNLDAATSWVEMAEEAAMQVMLSGSLAYAAAARSGLELEQGDARSALELSLEAHARFTRGGQAIEAARASIITGRALTALGDRERAIERLTEAHSRLAASGARRHQDEAARELRQLGLKVGSRGGRGPRPRGAALSPRELDVVDGVVRGLRNREIAAHLFISPKTVERHLSRIFEKLEVSTRTELAAAFARAGASANR